MQSKKSKRNWTVETTTDRKFRLTQHEAEEVFDALNKGLPYVYICGMHYCVAHIETLRMDNPD